ncbi:autotransporter outer membrane beta-barrel domain-containing protein [Sandaracinobacter neustonicus]|uniref:Autotransporter outer membrane beta-barrel domain-containing protein n=1 Tax=Sandaracinobacter neustonicus TaxID=1715348 RepID=A0A501XQA0_9SPHN|nr:autotransporter domain-containing protein [Sandaracinobacter neustonicus]TPE62851.1 autotransporter outer membrane beta-barrel domain-containing protein [Sandaracinobacter neustonicus]
MRNLKSTTAALAVAAALAFSGTASANTLYFQMNPNYGGGGQRQLFVFGQANATGTVTSRAGFNQSFDLGAEGFAVIDLSVSDELSSGSVQDLGFVVTSSSAVSGYYLSRIPYTTDMTYLIDGEKLGTNYVVAGYQNISPDQMSVQATQDGTTVTFTPKGSDPFTVMLDKGQTYMYTASANLTGSSILADKPISVFSGNQCTNVPTGVYACDHIMEQMPSVDQLSSTYMLAQTPRTGTLGNVIRVVATADNTEVRMNGTLVATLTAAGDFYEGRVAGGVELVATNPVLVAQYLVGEGEANANTDPAMAIVPGADQWLKSYVFATPSGTADFPTDFVSIVIQTSSLGTLTVDGVVADASLFNTLGSSIYSYGSIDVSGTTGPFTISADTPFQLMLMGVDSYDSYFTYGGAAFAPGASPDPETPPPPPGIDVYWDGDGSGSADNGNVDGGTGVLTAASVNLTLANGAVNNILPESATVIFGGAPGTVTIDDVDGALSFAGLKFNVDGYVLTGDSFELAGEGTPQVFVGGEVGEGGTTPFVATIGNVITGTQGFAKTGIGTLILTGANSYSGTTTVSEGTLIGNSGTFGTGGMAISEDGTAIFDQAVAGSFGQSFSGSGTLIKTGAGALTLTGVSSFSGDTLVNQGLLLVDGSLGASDVTVGAGAVLGGTGTVGNTVILSGGRIAPGGSIGTLNVAGNFTQSTGSFYDVELNSLGQSDLIRISGTATIEAGTVLNVTKLDTPRLALGTRYTVLTADGGRTGTYGSVTGAAARVSAFIGLVPSYDANNVYLNVARNRAFAAAGLTPNQIAAATGADAAGNGALYTAIAYLQTDAEAQAAFDSISGEIHASLRGVSLEDSRFVREAMVNRTVGAREPGKGLWISGYGSWASISGDSNTAHVNRDIGGFFIGGEMSNESGLIVGAVTGYGKGDITVDDRSSKADTSDAYLGGYVGFNALGFNARAGLAYQWRDVKTTRHIAFTGFSDTAQAKYNLNTFQAFADAGYKLELGGAGLEPFFQLAYVDVSGGSFSETGGAAALDGSGSENFWLTQLGTRFNFGLGTGIGVTGSIGWRHLTGGDRNTPVTMNLGAGPSFSIMGAPLAKDMAALSLGVGGSIGKNVSFDVGYSGVAGNGASDHGVRGSVIFRF